MIDSATLKKYNKLQWRTLIILMLGYAMYYFVRQNLAAAIPTLKNELGLTLAELGLFMSLHQIVYGVAKLFSGMMADRTSAKKLMAIGLCVAACCNVLIGLLPQINCLFNVLDEGGKITLGGIYFVGAIWVVNGFFQSFGYPPCASLMSRWFRPSDLSTKQSIWNTSHNIGAGLIFLLVAIIIKLFGPSAWQLFFFVPAALAFGTSAVIFFGLKDNPSDAGLPSPESLDEDDLCVEKGSNDEKSNEIVLSPVANRKLINKMSFGNPIVWLTSMSDFFVYIIRLLIIAWGATVLQEVKAMDAASSGVTMTVVEICGGILGTLLAGYVTDKFFKSKAHHTSLFCMVLATVCLFVFWKTPSDNRVLNVIMIILTSFFIYGPQALLGIVASNQATKRAAGTANGLVGVISYLSAVLAGWGFGAIVDNKMSMFGCSGWDLVFLLGVFFGILGTLCLALMWKAPANGYAKAEKLAEEYAAQYPMEQK